MRRGPAVMLALLLCGCASIADEGWQGAGAQPFDAASAQCQADTAGTPAGAARAAAFEACMAAQGWHRPAQEKPPAD